MSFSFKRAVNCIWMLDFYGHKAAHTALVCDCWLCPSPRWVLFFSSSESSLWADAIPSASSTCQMPLPALMADVLLDPVPASARPLCATVHFPASSAVLSQASPQVSLCKRVLSLNTRPHRCTRAQAPNVLGIQKVWETSDQSLKNGAYVFHLFYIQANEKLRQSCFFFHHNLNQNNKGLCFSKQYTMEISV